MSRWSPFRLGRVAAGPLALCVVSMSSMNCSSGGDETPTPEATPTQVPEGPTPTATPTPEPTPEPTPTAGVTPTFPPTPTPDPYPSCRTVTGDRGGIVLSVNGGDTLINNVVPIQAVSYTWDVAVSSDGRIVWESFMGALFKSRNAGCTFEEVTGLPSTRFKSISLDPNDAERLFLSSYDDPQIVAKDADDNWTLITPKVGNVGVTGIVALSVDAVDPDVLRFVSTEGGYYRSDDGGQSWTARPIEVPGVELTQVTGASFHPGSPSHIMVASNLDGFLRTTDDGVNWEQVNEGIYQSDDTPENTALVGIYVAYSPADPDVIYGVIGYPDVDKMIYRSTDGGDSWLHLFTTRMSITGGTRVYPHPTDSDRFITWFGSTFGEVYTDLYRCEVTGPITGGESVVSDTIRYNFPDIFGMAYHALDPNILYFGRVNDTPD